uniref:SMP-30/Gluconolactonase/LRE-like region domain-containing protein n=1 Tax=Branchiostoma floridae TaxID=7739 RepID=C3YG57_BRAFL|eukprot:XP_002604852.1 hypothetical protein BRAFLDRAFT_70704 [Branchiostoma floridae]
MYEQAQPVRYPVSGSGIGQTAGPSSQTSHCGQQRFRKDNNSKTCSSKKAGSSSGPYEEAEAVYHTINDRDVPPPLPHPHPAQHSDQEATLPRAGTGNESNPGNLRCEAHTSTDRTSEDGPDSHLSRCKLIRIHMYIAMAFMAIMIMVGFCLMMIANTRELTRLSSAVEVLQGDLHNTSKKLTAFDTLKRRLDYDESRITFLEERLHEMTKKLESSNETVESKISFGGRGSEPGKFNGNYGVAVSTDNEIFVTDYHNKRVQVFGMNGVFLRLFPTKVLLEHKHTLINPYGVAVDTISNVWVTGDDDDNDLPQVYVIKYSSKGGLPLTIFNKRKPTKYTPPTITIDKRNNRIIVAISNEILIFLPNGSLSQSFVMTQSEGTGLYPLTPNENGNVIIADYDSVHVYSKSGDHMYSFRGEGKDKGQMAWVSGIGVDKSGYIIVANTGNNRIDMFTKQGEFVRTMVRMNGPGALAIGPEGQLVVTSTRTVTVFQPRVVFL